MAESGKTQLVSAIYLQEVQPPERRDAAKHHHDDDDDQGDSRWHFSSSGPNAPPACASSLQSPRIRWRKRWRASASEGSTSCSLSFWGAPTYGRTDGRRPPTSARQKQTPEPRACVRVCVQIVEAMEIMLLAVASPEIRCEWRLDDWQVALVSTVSRIPSVGWKLPFLPTPTFVFLNSVFFPTCFSIFPPSDGVGILHTLRKMLFGSCSCLPVCFQMVFLGFMVCGALGGYVADRYGRWKVAHGLARRASRSLSRRGLVCVQVVYGGFVWSAYFSLLTSFAPSYAWFVFLRSMVGCGVAAVSQGSAARAPSQPPTAAFALGSASSSPLIFGAGNYLPIAPPVLFPRAPASGTEMSQL